MKAKLDRDIELNSAVKAKLERHSWRNWFLLAGIAAVSTLAFAATMPDIIIQHMRSSDTATRVWPWKGTEWVLFSSFCCLVLFFLVYLTAQQRRLVRVRDKLGTLEEQSKQTLEKYKSRLYALLEVSRSMSAQNNLDGVFDCITKSCARVFECDRASLMLLDENTQELVVKSISDADQHPDLIGKGQKIGQGISGWVARNRKPLILGRELDRSKHPDLELKDPSIAAAMIVPIMVRDELVGIINVSTHRLDARFGDDDLKAIQVFAENAGACIRHTQQAEWMRKTIKKLQETAATRN